MNLTNTLLPNSVDLGSHSGTSGMYVLRNLGLRKTLFMNATTHNSLYSA